MGEVKEVVECKGSGRNSGSGGSGIIGGSGGSVGRGV